MLRKINEESYFDKYIRFGSTMFGDKVLFVDSDVVFVVNFFDDTSHDKITVTIREIASATQLAYRVCDKMKLDSDKLKCFFIRNVLEHGSRRVNSPRLSQYSILFDKEQEERNDRSLTDEDLTVEVHYGDDIYLVASYYGLLFGLTHSGVNHLFQRLIDDHPQHNTSKWINHRKKQLSAYANISTENNTMTANNQVDTGEHFCNVSLAITTSKRLDLFRDTMSSIIENGSLKLPPSVCSTVLIVDDDSSNDDRISMLSEYKHLNISYIMKSSLEIGHARSLNMILERTKTQYLLYLEDDWVRIGDIENAIEDSLSILKHDNNIAQVLFNDQRSRPCAEGQLHCSTFGTEPYTGWKREMSKPVNKVTGKEQVGDTIIYIEHEFGVTYPNHMSFSYWPGFSLNPGIWDIHRLRDKMKLRFDEKDTLFEQSFALEALKSGLIFAHLPRQIFRHVGRGRSSYILNKTPRPWDKQ